MTLGIIQARMGSTRLPKKPTKKIAGIPLLDLVQIRVLKAKLLDKVVITTPSTQDDMAIYADFREPAPRDPLRGFFACAEYFGADIAVRLTADDPLKDPEIIDEVVGYMLKNSSLDYCSNTLVPTFPWGLDVEAIRFKTLKWLHESVTDELCREHVTYYIREHPEEFKTQNVEYDEDLHDWNWSVDTQKDLNWINALFKESGFDPVTVGYREVIEYVKAHRERSEVHTRGIAS